jgi:hypothetical protein
MGRPSRTYRLTLSPAGMDVLIDAHCHLIRVTRCLLAWGTTLHVAVACLDRAPAEVVAGYLDRLPALRLSGNEVHFLGAPARLNEVASRIARRVGERAPTRVPELGHLYIIALQHALLVNADTLKATHEIIAA